MNIRSHENGFRANIPSLESLADSPWTEMLWAPPGPLRRRCPCLSRGLCLWGSTLPEREKCLSWVSLAACGVGPGPEQMLGDGRVWGKRAP